MGLQVVAPPRRVARPVARLALRRHDQPHSLLMDLPRATARPRRRRPAAGGHRGGRAQRRHGAVVEYQGSRPHVRRARAAPRVLLRRRGRRRAGRGVREIARACPRRPPPRRREAEPAAVVAAVVDRDADARRDADRRRSPILAAAAAPSFDDVDFDDGRLMATAAAALAPPPRGARGMVGRGTRRGGALALAEGAARAASARRRNARALVGWQAFHTDAACARGLGSRCHAGGAARRPWALWGGGGGAARRTATARKAAAAFLSFGRRQRSPRGRQPPRRRPKPRARAARGGGDEPARPPAPSTGGARRRRRARRRCRCCVAPPPPSQETRAAFNGWREAARRAGIGSLCGVPRWR